jgi:hypothetical protein
MSPRVLLVEGGQAHDVLDLVELSESLARVRTAYLFELGEELRLRIERDGTTFEVPARVLAHVGADDDKVTELELGERP